MNTNDYTHITLVLDRSGSMGDIADETITGVNAFLKEQKELPGKATFTLVLFDHEYLIPHSFLPIQDVPELTSLTYVPRGYTAMRDAIGRAIVETGAHLAALTPETRPGKVLVAILTDGLENASKEYTQEKVAEMVAHQEEVYKWQFAFLGANQDAVLSAKSYGIQAASAMNFAPTSQGIQIATQALSQSTRSYRARSADAPEQDFWQKTEDSVR